MRKTIYIASFILTASINICKAQKILGTYREIGKPEHAITFSKETFKEEFKDDLLTKKGYGSYYFKNNKLTLSYKDYPQQDTSRYELINLGTLNNVNLDITIFDAALKPMWGIYGCRDLDNNILNIVGTDKEGRGNMTIFNNKNIGYFTIDCVGYYRISIPIKKIMGKAMAIKAYLKPQENYYIEPGTNVYQVVQSTSKQLILSKAGTTYTFEKIE